MTSELVSPTVFLWFVALFTGVVAFLYFVLDGAKLWKLRGADKRDPVVHDKRFGYVIGMFVGGVGTAGTIVGVMRFYQLL